MEGGVGVLFQNIETQLKVFTDNWVVEVGEVCFVGGRGDAGTCTVKQVKTIPERCNDGV